MLQNNQSLKFFFILLLQGVQMDIIEVSEFWPEVADDLTLVKWSHATNSRELLDTAIADDTMMIEADVSIGGGGIPIMAHPPQNESDLTLEEFMNTVIASANKGVRKGIKLDFKFIAIVKPSLDILKELEEKFRFPVWLNADILQGPGGSSTPVDADQFLNLCTEYFPEATLSIGYTTSAEGKYTAANMNEMFNLLKQKGIVSPVTLPLRACLAARSIAEIEQFLKMVDANESFPTTITIWSGTSDDVDLENLDKLITEIGKNRIYLDVPWTTAKNGEAKIGSNLSVLTIFTTVLALLKY
eukprot:GFUD01002518.1.p1 GENE.GFUD01002518.1~~GFUD01002518.1.p1  ORF type:complete len:316 (-),score=64.31 GFUD01002518.1:46-945(-)